MPSQFWYNSENSTMVITNNNGSIYNTTVTRQEECFLVDTTIYTSAYNFADDGYVLLTKEQAYEAMPEIDVLLIEP